MVAGQTKLTNVADPEVLADMLQENIGKNIQFAP